ncbi:alpha/beta fold hydrolase [Conexibacter sp. SYSU D00693]|uniref:alpha/beta fold hydrolase n=1 Tax=Conexibacter sp. SYSU D00693 TaxID=2812560 RepID=UPI00196A6899|nr:alpha/beta hydrolase [Conexibacter sp. SYSU D00693]
MDGLQPSQGLAGTAGRRIAYATFGAHDGVPVFYLHGAIGSPLTCSPGLGDAIEALGLRLVAVQRPGFGRSDPQPGRTLADHAHDLATVADVLGIERFGVLGVSAGGPYAVACAHVLGDRLTAAAAVSSLSPLCRPADVPGLPARVRVALKVLAAAPRAATWAGDRAVALVARHPQLLVRAMTVGAPPADRTNLADGATARAAIAAFLEATGGGLAGLVEDHLVTSRPWGFDLADVQGEVHVWHGMHDAFVPAEHALQLAAALPRCRVALDPGEGHFFFRRRATEVLGALVRRADLPRPLPAA